MINGDTIGALWIKLKESWNVVKGDKVPDVGNNATPTIAE